MEVLWREVLWRAQCLFYGAAMSLSTSNVCNVDSIGTRVSRHRRLPLRPEVHCLTIGPVDGAKALGGRTEWILPSASIISFEEVELGEPSLIVVFSMFGSWLGGT